MKNRRPFTLHDLRRTCRTTLSRLGVDEETAELVIGHLPPGMAKTYNLYDRVAEHRAALEQWAGFVGRRLGLGRQRAVKSGSRHDETPQVGVTPRQTFDHEARSGYDPFRPIPWFARGPMEEAMRVDDWVPKTVVFIGRESREQFLPEGTGFITATLVSADQGWQTIVTAKHVIEPFPDEDRICARLNGRDGKARLLQLPEAGWYFHEDPAIDVTVFPITIGKDVFEFAHFPIADFLPPDSPVAPKNVAVNP